jgi:hypothetical protein
MLSPARERFLCRFREAWRDRRRVPGQGAPKEFVEPVGNVAPPVLRQDVIGADQSIVIAGRLGGL